MDNDLRLLTARLAELSPDDLKEALDVACASGRRESRVAFLERGDHLIDQNDIGEYFETIIGPAIDADIIEPELTAHWRALMDNNELEQDPRPVRFLECWREQREFERRAALRRNETISKIEESSD